MIRLGHSDHKVAEKRAIRRDTFALSWRQKNELGTWSLGGEGCGECRILRCHLAWYAVLEWGSEGKEEL